MPYSRAFFALQLEFAEMLSAKFDIPLREALREYTTFTKSLGQGEEWQAYLLGLEACPTFPERAEWTYRWYLPRAGTDPHRRIRTFTGMSSLAASTTNYATTVA